MSVDVASLPAWKLALLERKRRQDVDPDGGVSKSDGSETLENIPPWKQEILFRKQKKRNSTGRTYEGVDGENRRSLSEILLSPEDGERCSLGVDSWPGLLSPVRDYTYNGDLKTTYHLSNTEVDRASGSELVPVEEERLPPVHQNPILLLDLEKRTHSGFLVGLTSPGASDPEQRSSLPSKLSKLQVSGAESLDTDNREHIQRPTNVVQNDVFREEEVTYGKGFVSRLLQKFSYLSGRDDQPPLFFRSLSRGQSSEDFTKHRYEPDVGSRKNPGRRKANSLDDLLAETRNSQSVVENGSATNGLGHHEGMQGLALGHEEVGIVLSAKSVFESLATSPTSTRNLPSQDHRYASAKSQEGVTHAEKPKEPTVKEGKDDPAAPSGVRQTHSSTIAHHPPAILGPKPVYPGHAALLPSAEPQSKKRPDAQRSVDVMSTVDTAEKTRISAQTTSVSTDWGTADQVHNITRSISESRSLFSSNETTSPATHDSNDHEGYLCISPHIQEPSTTKEPVPAVSISIPALSRLEEPSVGNAKTHEPPLKEHAPKKTPPSRPGLLLIRPASNLTSTRTEYLQMTKYNDITRGEFAPAKRPIHKAGGSDDEEDRDVDEMDGSGDCSKYLKVRYEFEGGGVRIGRSLLAKTKQGIQVWIHFFTLPYLLLTFIICYLSSEGLSIGK